MAQELNEQKKIFNENWGFHKLVKDVADYTLTPFFQLMDMPCLNVFGIAQMMLDEADLNSIHTSKKEL
ncbi:hypothetical protein CHU00_18430 [Sphingobacterium cellulitidis]|uniref:hypothetical protein n=1 Tax=Sphingobacterium cellulitidis TaxID=1768011 RepID=UPI000B9445C6|nr:hypothetical protein [Sphingobacterium cellulitidis]OYD44144.1 hypothetical protein CHU00_18430 [Sphingobacterium cellulitidis]